jgi:uncharacterized protein (DUF1015 family)
MPSRPVVVTQPEEAQAEPEVRVVVDRIEVDRPMELGGRGGVTSASEVRAPERLADRRLLGLDVAGALERDRCCVHVSGLQEAEALLERAVRVADALVHWISIPSSLVSPCDNRMPPTKATSVPDLAPFRGLRYTTGSDLTAVTAPPYDVIDAGERVTLLASDPNNSVRLILPDDSSGDPYEGAATTLAKWRADGVLEVDPAPMLYSYRMEAARPGGKTHRTVGVIGALALPGDGAVGDVLPHERTLPKAKSDRLALLRATRANFDPIWGLTLSSGLTELVADVPTVAVAVDRSGVRHELGLISDDDRIEAIRSLVRAKAVVLADGHHRFETACTYRTESPDDGAGAILCLVVELDDAQLDVRPFHRLVSGAPDDLRARLGEDSAFAVRDRGVMTPAHLAGLLDEMDASGSFGLVDADGLALLALEHEPGASSRLEELPEPLRGVDAARFDVAVRPHLGDAVLSYRSDPAAVVAALGSGEANAAILLRRVTVAQIRAAAASGVRMPEKTTYFAPKPLTGMVMRSLDD